MTEKLPNQITLAHGAGGKQTSALIHEIFAKYFDNPFLTADDAAVLPRPGRKIAMSTDGFVVSPAFFPGGNIGELSICGTVNDLTCMGAKPLYLTCAFIIEEGLETAKLDQIAKAMAETAQKVGVVLVAILGLAITELRLPFCSEIAFAAVPFLWCGRLLYKRLCASAALVGGGNFSSCYGGNGDVQSPCGYADTCLWLLVAILYCGIRTNHSSCHIQQMACWEGIWYPSMAWAQQSGCHVRT